MNKDRRKALSNLCDEVRALEGTLSDLKDQLDTLRDEEQEYYDNMPENMQDGDKGQLAQTAIEAMEEAINALDEMIGNVDTAVSGIESAQE
jgi:uncharacterized coiled-coil DUF342 family protein